MNDTAQNTDDNIPEDKDVREAIDAALDIAVGERLTEIVESISTQDALRHV